MTKSLIPGSLIFLLALFAGITDVSGQSCLTGKIIQSGSGTPVQDVNIKINDSFGGITCADGIFRICSLPPETVSIQISHMGYNPVQLTWVLKPGENRLNDILLQPSFISMDELVITATRTDSRLMNTPVRVNMITPGQINQLPLQNIDDALRFTPGLNVGRPSGIFSSKSTISMRGMSGKEQARVLVLLDGIPINKSDGGTVDWNLVDVSSIDRIEVTKGPGSAIYGGNAMGGIINMITKKTEDNFFLNASLEYGTYQTFGGRLRTGSAIKLKTPDVSWNWSVNIFHKQSEGYITQSEADVAANPYIEKSNMRETGLGLKTSLSIKDKHRLDLSISVFDDRRGNGEKVHQSEGNTTDHDSYGIRLNYSGTLGNPETGLKVSSVLFTQVEFYKKVNEYLKDDYTWYNVLSERADMGWMNTITKRLGTYHQLTAGADLKNGIVDAYDEYYTSTDIVYNKGKMSAAAAFIQDEIKLFSNKVSLLAGIRYDVSRFYDGAFFIDNPTMETSFMRDYEVPVMQTQTWSAVSPRLSVQYRWSEDTRVFAGYSKGFRPSVLDDLCRSGRIKGGFKLANPYIKPEFLNNFETGLDLGIAGNLNWSSSVYYSKGKGFQYYVANGMTIDMGFGERPILIRANISSVEIYGLETDIRYTPVRNLSVFVNYAYTSSKIDQYRKIAQKDTINLSGKYMTDVPEQLLATGASYSGRHFQASAWIKYTGSAYINDQNIYDELVKSDQYPAFTTVDLKISKTFREKYQLSLNIQNLLDTKYYDSKYAVCPGRFITAEISFKL